MATTAAPDLLSGEGLAPPTSTGYDTEKPSDSNYVSMEMAQGPSPEDHDAKDDDDDEVQSMVSSVLTADGIHDFTGFCCVCLVILLGDMSRGVMFPTMWPLVQTIGGDQVTLGFSVASFSFGRVLVNPLFGALSHTYGYSKVLMVSCSILLLGTLMYAQIQNVGSTAFLILAQTVLGIGSGTLGVTRAFVADVTAKRNRTTYMALITAVQYAGFTVTPFFGALFTQLLQGKEYYPDEEFQFFRLTMYTAPAYFMALLVAGTLGILSVYFQDRQRIQIVKDSKKKSSNQVAREDYGSTPTWVGLTIYDCCILGCLLLNVATKGSIATFETMGIAVAQSHFDMQSSRAGTIVASCGSVGVIALLCMSSLSARFTDVQLISGGMVVMGAGVAILVNIENHIHNPSWQFFGAIFLIYGVGYPIGHTAVIGLFSKSKSGVLVSFLVMAREATIQQF
jgi:ceroid-lipofuscinosis MFS transporter 7